MRTNIDIDDALMAEAIEIGGFATKRAAVEAALKELVESGRRRNALKAMRGMGWEGDLDQMRQDWTPVHAAERDSQVGDDKK